MIKYQIVIYNIVIVFWGKHWFFQHKDRAVQLIRHTRIYACGRSGDGEYGLGKDVTNANIYRL